MSQQPTPEDIKDMMNALRPSSDYDSNDWKWHLSQDKTKLILYASSAYNQSPDSKALAVHFASKAIIADAAQMRIDYNDSEAGYKPGPGGPVFSPHVWSFTATLDLAAIDATRLKQLYDATKKFVNTQQTGGRSVV